MRLIARGWTLFGGGDFGRSGRILRIDSRIPDQAFLSLYCSPRDVVEEKRRKEDRHRRSIPSELTGAGMRSWRSYIVMLQRHPISRSAGALGADSKLDVGAAPLRR